MKHNENPAQKTNLITALTLGMQRRIYPEKDLSIFSEEERAFFLAASVKEAVCLGHGLSGFFLESGNWFPELEKSFAAIGSPVAAAICRCAAELFPGDIPRDEQGRSSLLNPPILYFQEKNQTVLDQCDRALLSLDKTLTELLYSYATENANRFVSPLLRPFHKPIVPAVPHPFRDDPYVFRASGIRVYEENGNPYETVIIYLDLAPDFVGVKSYISEHGPDGISSWRGIFLDFPNGQEFREAAGGDIEAFLKGYLRDHASEGLIDLSRFLKEQKIAFKEYYAF